MGKVTSEISMSLDAAAGDKNVGIWGGANIMRQYLKAGLLDEMQIHRIPVLLGGGVRLLRSPSRPRRVICGVAVLVARYRSRLTSEVGDPLQRLEPSRSVTRASGEPDPVGSEARCCRSDRSRRRSWQAAR
jgi:hypothetical protein